MCTHSWSHTVAHTGVLPPLAVVDPNVFRRERLYTADMERAIVHNLELLTAAFKLFKVRPCQHVGI